MLPKIRELIKRFEKAGFKDQGGKGSHRNFIRSKCVVITISGNFRSRCKAIPRKSSKTQNSRVTKGRIPNDPSLRQPDG